MITHKKSIRHPRIVIIDLKTKQKSNIRHQPFDKVTIGEPLLNGGVFPYSTVSGIVKSIERKAQTLHITIENDRKDTVYSKLQNFNTKTMIERYHQTALTLESLYTKSPQNLIVMSYFFNEPFVSVYPGFILEHQTPISAALSFLKTTYGFKKIIVLVSEHVPSHIEEAIKDIDSDIQLKSVDLQNTPHHMTESINLYANQALYNAQPYNFLTIDSLIQMAEIIKHHRPPTLNYVVFSGDLVRQPSIIEARIGTPIIQLIDLIGGLYGTLHSSVIVNEILRQKQYPAHYESLDRQIKSLHFNQTFNVDVMDCIICGACNDHCPVGIIPSRIMRYTKHGQSTRFLAPFRCIECGLCSFSCPSKIPVLDSVKKAKMSHQKRWL